MPPGHATVRFLLLRCLGVVGLIAFASLWVQIHGLVGEDGVLPVYRHFGGMVTQRGHGAFWDAPSLLWWAPSDAGLSAACAGGVTLSALLALGLPLEGPLLLGMWALYLSLCHAGQRFLGFQWDTLLTETLFVAMLIARWHPWAPRRPSVVGIWAMRWLLFKLMLGAGLVKLTSGDATWWDGTALTYHYWTQPIPNPASWFFHHLPVAWHKLETWATLIIEILLPFLMFAGRPGRRIAFVSFVLVLGLLMVSGNYGFFQLLSLVLCLSLLDDADIRFLPIGERMVTWGTRQTGPVGHRVREAVCATLLVPMVGLGVVHSYGRVFDYQDLHPTALGAVRAIYPWRTVNAYGLFANMTEERPEVTLEGSHDGQTWTPYVFRYKPGPLERMPPQIAPHMPRLDWQMWFAALSSCERNAWVVALMQGLQEQRPAVVGLLAEDPFDDRPPRWIRATRVRYRFSEPGNADWWVTVGQPRPFCPTLGPR